MKDLMIIATLLIYLVRYATSWGILHPNIRSMMQRHSHIPQTTVMFMGDDNDDNISSNSMTPIDTSLPRDENIWKTEGERIIRNAALSVGAEGALKEEDVVIQWKSDKIIVTIEKAILKASSKSDEDDDSEIEIEYDDDVGNKSGFMITDIDDEDEFHDNDDEDSSAENSSENKADVVSIARAINYALGEDGEDSLGYKIAFHHEIEVTTPGASDELEGIMFESYKGFNVIVETLDPKKKDGKVKIVEGNLVERTDEFLILNCKGRRRKLKNQNVFSVKLPKAKREKGVK